MPTIDSLELEVQSSSQSAVSGIDALSASLSRLKTAVKGGVGLTSVTNQLKNINDALQSVDDSAAGKLNTLANSLEKLRNLGNLKISSSIASQITSIGTATRSLSGVDFSPLGELATAIQPLGSIGSLNLSSTINQLNKLPAAIGALNGVDIASTASKIRELVSALGPLTTIGNSNLGSFFSQIRKLPEMVQTLNEVDIDGFADRIRRLTSAIAPLDSQLNGIASVFDRIPERILRIILRMDDLTERNDRASTSYVNLWAKCRMAMTSMQTAARVIASWVTKSNSYIENLNLFTASMGKYAESAREYAETVGEVMGIDPGEWMRNQGVFMTITKGFGVASDRAYTMSKNLTQLGYDLSSFFNIPFEDAMQKLQSGISGELEPLRRLGYDLSQARLKAVALSLGIKKSFNDMTQAEKAQLRYYTIMKQVTVAQGDMARTLEAPANQLRILQAQVTQCARALGNIFIPALNAVLPYAIALVNVLRKVAEAIALFFGFTLPEVDYSGLGEVGDSVDDIGEGLEDATKAAKKLKNAVLGIDELNIISPNDANGGGAGGGTVGGFDFELPEYDFLGDALSKRADEIQKWMEKILPLIAEIGAGLAAWAIADSLIPDLGRLESLLGGLLLAVGLTLLIDSIKDIIINKELTWGNILEGMAGGALAGAGLGLMLAKQFGLTWKNGMLLGAVIGVGLSLAIMSIVAEIVSGLDLGKILLGALGGAIAGGGVGAGIMLKSGGSLVHGAALGAVIGVGVVLSIMGIIAEIQDGVNFGNGLLTAIGGALIGAGLGYWLGGTAGALIGISIGVGVSLLITGIISELQNGVNAGNGILTAIGGALTGAGIGFKIGGAVGGIAGAVVGIGVSLVITGLIHQVQSGVDIAGALMTILGSALAGAGIGFTIGGPAGAAVGAAIGVVVGIGLEFIGVAEAGKAAYEASEDFRVMENIIDRSTETVNRCADALKNMETNISGLESVSADFAAASQLVSEIFDINENANASNYELELMRVKVDVLNGMNIQGLSLSIDETTGRVVESRQEVEKLIESLQREAQMEAMKSLLVDTYKNLATAQKDAVQSLKDYGSASEALRQTSEELANCPWYDFQRHSELTAAQKEQTEAVRNAQQAYADSRNAIDELTGTIDLYSGQIVDMKLAEVGVGDELVNGLGNVQSSLDEVAGSMQGYGQNIAEGLRNGIDENTQEAEYKSIWQRIGDWFTSLFDINSPSRVAYSWGEYISAGLLNGLSETWGSIGTFFSEKTDAIKQICSEAWENVKSTASEKWASIKTDLGETWENIKISAGEKFEAVKEKVGTVWETVKTATSEKWESIKSTLGTTWENIKTNASTTFDNVKQKISDTWSSAKSTSSETWNNIKSTVGGIWSGLKTNASTTFDNIRQNISTAWDKAKTNTSTTWGNIKTSLGTTWDNLKTDAGTKFEEVRQKVSDAWGNIKQEIPSKWDDIKSSLKTKWDDIVSSAKSWGSDLCDNLASGISSGIRWVQNAARDVADTVSSYLHFSEPDIGPLSNFHTFMPDMLKLMSSGIRANSYLAENAVYDLTNSIANTLDKSKEDFEMPISTKSRVQYVVDYSEQFQPDTTPEDGFTDRMRYANGEVVSALYAIAGQLVSAIEDVADRPIEVGLDGNRLTDQIERTQRERGKGIMAGGVLN